MEINNGPTLSELNEIILVNLLGSGLAYGINGSFGFFLSVIVQVIYSYGKALFQAMDSHQCPWS